MLTRKPIFKAFLELIKRKYLLLVAFFLSLNSSALDTLDLYQILNNSTIRVNIIENYGTEQRELHRAGSGVIINEYRGKYYILTNAHVLLSQFCLLDAEDENCQDYLYDESKTIVVDTTNSSYEYPITDDDFIFWENLDLAVIVLDSSMYEEMDGFEVIEMGGIWHPLQKVYSAGFPLVLGNYKDYRNIFYDSCVINSVILDEESLIELDNYSIVHDCRVAGGMSGGPLVSDDGELMGINGLAGDAILEQGIFGQITSTDFDNLNYAYAIHIYELYSSVLTTNSGNFNPQSKFYNFLPRLSIYEHQGLYDYFIEELNLEKTLVNKIFK